MDAHYALYNESVSDYVYPFFSGDFSSPPADDTRLVEMESQIATLKKCINRLEGLRYAMPARQKALSEMARLTSEFRLLKGQPH